MDIKVMESRMPSRKAGGYSTAKGRNEAIWSVVWGGTEPGSLTLKLQTKVIPSKWPLDI
jgi:hypothetical protein